MRTNKMQINYDVNSAVIKNSLEKLSKEELIEEGRYIKNMARDTPPGNKRRMYIKLFQYCKHLFYT